MEFKEAQLFKPLKKYFKEQGYKVYAEVPCFSRGVDFVAAKGDDHIAVEMKMYFNDEVAHQASGNQIAFGRSYVAFPVKEVILIPEDFEDMQRDNHTDFRRLRESVRDRYSACERKGIGILQVVGNSKLVVEVLPAQHQKPYRIFDFSQYQESDDDEAGLPFQKGVSAGYMELKAIEQYVIQHPQAGWREIFENVQNHYSDHRSLAGSMAQWRGFSLSEFKESLGIQSAPIQKEAPPPHPSLFDSSTSPAKMGNLK